MNLIVYKVLNADFFFNPKFKIKSEKVIILYNDHE